jgi:hypothetical protein
MGNDKNLISIDNYKIIKEIGRGMTATIYLVSYNNKYYALKINKILSENIKYNIKSDTWREIDFSINFANKYPDQFMKLYSYDIINDCKHKQNYKFYIKSLSEQFTKLDKSNYCIRKIYSLVDTILKKVISELNKKQIYSMIIQLTYCIYLMKSNKYVHADLHTENIGVIKVNKEIKIFDKIVPTFGYQFIIIDFGSVLHEDFLLNEEEKEKYNYYLKNEINKIIKILITFDSNNKIYKLFNKNSNNKIAYDNFLKSSEYDLIKKIGSSEEDCYYLYQIMFPGSFQKEYLGNKFKKVNMPLLKCDLEDILYFFKNKNELETIINYFIKKI